MRIRRSMVLLDCAAALALGLTACGTSSRPSIPPTPPIPPITVAFMPAPPSSMFVNATAMLTAVVSNDSSNAGVDWSVTCGSAGACGSFSPSHTASGSATTYTAPAAVPTGNTVTVTTTSTANSTKSVSATITITPPISVAFMSAPPSSMFVNDTEMLTAVVSNDSSNAGVDWSVTCGSAGACGSFSPTHTASGAATAYTAPGVVPTGNTVTVKATSTADNTKTATANVTISPKLPAGNYVFNFTGFEVSTSSPYSVAGVFTSDGNGNITGGEQDFSDLSISAFADLITSGSYTIGADGRGTITLVTADTSIGVSGTETLSVVLVGGGTRGFVIEFDSFGSASGNLSPQTLTSFSTSTLAQGFAFAMLGTDFGSFALTWGGVLNIDSPGMISGAGSVSDEDDAGTTSFSQPISGSVTSPDSLGRVIFSVNPAFATGVVISGYIADASHVALVELDRVLGVTGGTAIGQGAKTGTFNNTDLSGTAVFNGSGANISVSGDLAAAGLVTADGAGKITGGTLDVESAGTPITTSISGTYAVDANGTGRGVITLNPNSAGLTTIVTYLVGGGNPAFVLNMDSTSLTSGLAFSQSGTFTASTFTGNYGFGAQNFFLRDNLTGQVEADGVSSLAGNEDINTFGVLSPNTVLTGTFTANSNGQFPGSFNSGSFTVDFFLASGSLGVFVETDSLGQLVGIFALQ